MTATTAGRLLAGRYRLGDVLGRGGMGVVRAGRDEVLGRDVAVKEVLPPPELEPADRERLRRRTLREARAAARISSRHAVTVFDVVEEDGRPWIVMELLPAHSLADAIRERGPLPPAEVAAVGRDVLDGLRAAAAAGVLHRDVKPSNVLLHPDGRAVLGDFGIAMLEGDATVTTTGLVVGSPAYMAPERARGEHATLASDLWSLGATLYAALEGRPPFEREGTLATLSAVLHDPTPPVSVDGELGRLVTALLAKDPAARPELGEVRRALEAALGTAPAAPSAGATTVASGAAAGAAAATAAGAGPDVHDTTTAAGAGPDADDTATVAGRPSPSPAAPPAAPAPSPAPAAAEGPTDRPAPASLPAPPTPAAMPAPTPAPAAPPDDAAPVAAAAPPLEAAESADDDWPSAGREPDIIPFRDSPQEHVQVVDPHRDRRRRRARGVVLALVVVAAALVAVALGSGRSPWPWASDDPGARTSTDGSPAADGGSPPASAGADPTGGADASTGTEGGGDDEGPGAAGGAAGGGQGAGQGADGAAGTAGGAAGAGQGAGADSGGAAAVPAGLELRADPTGFTVAVPPGWTREASDTRVWFREPGTGRYLLVDTTTTPQADPYQNWVEYEPALRERFGGYERIRLERVDFRGWNTADLEYTYAGRNDRVHVINRNIRVSDTRAYALYWSTPESLWAESRPLFDQIASTFQPAPG